MTKIPHEFMHITGLFLDQNANPLPNSQLIGHTTARKALFNLSKTLKSSSNNIFIIHGPQNCGKTVLTHAFLNEMPQRTIRKTITAKDLQNINLRSLLNIKFKETKLIYEGEITSINKQTKSISIRTNNTSKNLSFSPEIFKLFEQENINIGDITYIETNTGIIKKLGKSENYMIDNELDIIHYVPIPKGEILRKREVYKELSLNDLDKNATIPSGLDTLSTLLRATSNLNTKIPTIIKKTNNENVYKYINKSVCELYPGTLIIKNAHTLKPTELATLKHLCETEIMPNIFLITNCNLTDNEHIFGFKRNLVENAFIIEMQQNSVKNQVCIVRNYANLLKIQFDDENIGLALKKTSVGKIIKIMQVVGNDRPITIETIKKFI